MWCGTIFYIFQPARRQATATVSQKDRDGIQLNTENERCWIWWVWPRNVFDLTPKCFGPRKTLVQKKIGTKMIFGLNNLFYSKIFLTQIMSLTNKLFFNRKKYFLPKIFWPKKYFWPHKYFWAKKILLTQKIFLTYNIFLP